MKRSSFLIPIVLSVTLIARLQVHAEHYDIYILAGQSNMDGRALKKDLTGSLAQWSVPDPDVVISYSNSSLRGAVCSSEGWKPLEPGYSVPPRNGCSATALPGGTFGPEVSFGRTMAEGMPGKHIALIKFAKGGTTLQKDWNPGNSGLLHDQFLAFVRASLLALTRRGDTYQIDGIAWHQGEGDAAESAEVYEHLLAGWIDTLRKDFSSPDLPIVIGELFENGKRDSIRIAQKAVCKSRPDVYFVSSEALTTLDKDTHFDAPSQIEIGRRMAEAFLQHLGKKPNR